MAQEEWSRWAPALNIDAAALTALIRPAFPHGVISECEPIEGGLRNTNIRVRLRDHDTDILVRLYQGDDAVQARKEQALSDRLGGKVPIPRFFYFRTDNPVTGHPYAILEWKDGLRLGDALRSAGNSDIARIGEAVGQALAGIHKTTFDRPGFFDATLRIQKSIDVGGKGLVSYLRKCLIRGHGGKRLGSGLTRAVLKVAAERGHLLATWRGPPCLVHGDFSSSNVLVSPTATGWTVTAVLDWEFAFSGSPFFDLGNLLRPPLGEPTGFHAAVHRGYLIAGGTLPSDWFAASRLADLFAWAEFLNRAQAGPAVIATARRRIADISSPPKPDPPRRPTR